MAMHNNEAILTPLQLCELVSYEVIGKVFIFSSIELALF